MTLFLHTLLTYFYLIIHLKPRGPGATLLKWATTAITLWTSYIVSVLIFKKSFKDFSFYSYVKILPQLWPPPTLWNHDFNIFDIRYIIYIPMLLDHINSIILYRMMQFYHIVLYYSHFVSYNNVLYHMTLYCMVLYTLLYHDTMVYHHIIHYNIVYNKIL